MSTGAQDRKKNRLERDRARRAAKRRDKALIERNLRQYQRTSDRHSADPNDRQFDHRIIKALRRTKHDTQDDEEGDGGPRPD